MGSDDLFGGDILSAPVLVSKLTFTHKFSVSPPKRGTSLPPQY